MMVIITGLVGAVGPALAGPGPYNSPFPNKGPFPNSGTMPGPLHKPKPYCDPRVCDDFRHRPSYGHRHRWHSPFWAVGTGAVVAASTAFEECYTVRRRVYDRHGHAYLKRIQVCEQ
jgi:hypothetical protein